MHSGVKAFKCKLNLKRIIRAQEGIKVDSGNNTSGSKMDWSALALAGMSAIQGIQSGILKNKEIETAKASIKAKKKLLENLIDMKAIDLQARQLLEQQSGGDVHFGEVDFQLVKQRLLLQAIANAKTKAELYEQEALSQLDQNAGMNLITDSITGFTLSGIGMLAQGFGNKNNTITPSSTGTSVTTNNSIFLNNSMFSPSNYNNPAYVNNMFKLNK